ncbi:cilia- and flagella-associated protein 91 [Drosophila gunungcola]|uniref:cilia- and flagella-associated protein 91 n=1 Tax=Drosophila gunungcola TaxID=103775 RepID=UPI0022DEE045|nr:cilia- and flagella-associated protein 91 [Drosophila gunungcola]
MRHRKQSKKVRLQEERKDRILRFLQENREARPIDALEKQSFASQKNQPKNVAKNTKTELASCLILTPSTDQRLIGGEIIPSVRKTGTQPRDDEECKFNAPGVFFLKGRNTNIIEHEVVLKPSRPQRKELKNKCDFFPKYVNPQSFKEQNTQTLYRESSAQTLAYLPEIYPGFEDPTLELFRLPSVLPGSKPPGLYEVEVLERSRKRQKFLEAVKVNFSQKWLNDQKLTKCDYKSLMEALEWEHWMGREEQIQECQMMRLEIVIKMFDKREKEMHAASKTRLERGYELIEKRRKEALQKNEIEYQRGMRQISKELAKTSLKWEKQTPMYSLGSPCSDFYAPPMRYGVDPARRNFASTTGTRAFNMRIDELERQINLRIVECPFAKLKQWSRPKERIQEVENRFCSETHLDALYQSLRKLSDSHEDQRPKPDCLKVRPKSQYMSSEPSRQRLMTMKSFSSLYAKNEEIARQSQRLSAREALRQKLSRQRNQLPVEGAEKRSKDDSGGDMRNMIVAYEGSAIGYVLQFLTDEMKRLREERRMHFLSVLAQKERWRRESIEAGLRQKENTMRMLYEEMFQQSNLIRSDISNRYILNILTNDVGCMAENEATETVTGLARQIDVDIERWLESFKLIQNPLTFIPLRLMLKDMVCPDLNAVLQRYETSMIAQYIVDEVIFGRVWKELEPYDITSTLTSDLIDRLIDNDLYLFSSSESESESPQDTSWYEAHAIIRKLIRQSVPGRRWKEEIERIVYENYNDLLDDIFTEIIYKNDNPAPIEPVVVYHSLSHENLLVDGEKRLKQREKGKLLEYQSDINYGSRVLKTQLLNLKKKKKMNMPASLDTLYSKTNPLSPDADDNPWDYLPDCITPPLQECCDTDIENL